MFFFFLCFRLILTLKLNTSDLQLAEPVHTNKSINYSSAVKLAVMYVYKIELFILDSLLISSSGHISHFSVKNKGILVDFFLII